MTPITAVATVLTAALRLRGVRGFSSGLNHQIPRHFVVNSRSPSVHHTRVSPFVTFGLRRMTLSSSNKQLAFVDFLESAQINASEILKQNNGSNSIQLVMGNEAGDADSIVSALSLAHVNTLSGDSKCLNVPLVSIPRSDLPLRRDAILLLDMAGIIADELIYMDDEIANAFFLDSSDVSITLVDHNCIRSSLSRLSDRVSAILDHHEDEQSHVQVTIDSGNRIIAFEDGFATVASTCTLVAEKLFRSIGSSARVDRALGLVLLGVILLDSVNMLPEAGKGTARDEVAIHTLLKQTDWSAAVKRTPSLIDDDAINKIFPNGRGAQPDRTALFDALSGAKFDPKFWHGMSAKDCLRIDYKRFPVAGSTSVQSIGISSALMDMKSVLEKPNFHQVMTDYVASQNIDILGVMTIHESDEGTWIRELLLAGRDDKLVDSFAEHLLNHHDAAFLEIKERKNCIAANTSSGLHTQIFSQGNVKGSRKQIAPVLLNYASTL